MRRGSFARGPGLARGEAGCLPPLELDHALEAGSEGGKVVFGARFDPGGMGEARLAGQVGDEVGWHLRLAVVGDAHDAEVGALDFLEGAIALGGTGAGVEGGEEIAYLGRGCPLVRETLDDGDLLRALRHRLGRHVGFLVPTEEGSDVAEEGDFAVELDEPLEFLAHGFSFIGWVNPSIEVGEGQGAPRLGRNLAAGDRLAPAARGRL